MWVTLSCHLNGDDASGYSFIGGQSPWTYEHNHFRFNNGTKGGTCKHYLMPFNSDMMYQFPIFAGFYAV